MDYALANADWDAIAARMDDCQHCDDDRFIYVASNGTWADEMLLPMPTDGTPMSVYRVRCPFCERRPLKAEGE